MEIKESLAYKMQLERSWPFAPSKEAIAGMKIAPRMDKRIPPIAVT